MVSVMERELEFKLICNILCVHDVCVCKFGIFKSIMQCTIHKFYIITYKILYNHVTKYYILIS